MTPTVAVFYDYGAVGPLDIGLAADGIADLVFVLDLDSRHGQAAEPIAAELGTVVDLASTHGLGDVLRSCSGITTFSDSRLLAVAEHAHRHGFAQHSRETALALTDKNTQRRRLSAAGIDCPTWTLLPAGVERSTAEHRIRGIPSPLVVKPTRGTGSRSAYPVVDSAALSVVLDRLYDGNDALTEDLIAEQMWLGAPRPGPFTDFVSVETVSVSGRHTHIGITERLPLQPPLREGGSGVPDQLDGASRAQLTKHTHQALNALGVEYGVSHTEFKLTPQGPKIIEVNGRVGGFVDVLYQRAGSYEVARAAFLAALGHEPPAPVKARCSTACVIFPASEGAPPQLSAVAEIASEVQALPGVWAVEVTDGASGGSPLAEGTMSSPMIAWLATEPAKFQQDLARVTARMNAFTGTEARPALQQKE